MQFQTKAIHEMQLLAGLAYLSRRYDDVEVCQPFRALEEVMPATKKKKNKKKKRRPVILEPRNPPDSFTLAELRAVIAKVAAARRPNSKQPVANDSK